MDTELGHNARGTAVIAEWASVMAVTAWAMESSELMADLVSGVLEANLAVDAMSVTDNTADCWGFSEVVWAPEPARPSL